MPGLLNDLHQDPNRRRLPPTRHQQTWGRQTMQTQHNHHTALAARAAIYQVRGDVAFQAGTPPRYRPRNLRARRIRLQSLRCSRIAASTHGKPEALRLDRRNLEARPERCRGINRGAADRPFEHRCTSQWAPCGGRLLPAQDANDRGGCQGRPGRRSVGNQHRNDAYDHPRAMNSLTKPFALVAHLRAAGTIAAVLITALVASLLVARSAPGG